MSALRTLGSRRVRVLVAAAVVAVLARVALPSGATTQVTAPVPYRATTTTALATTAAMKTAAKSTHGGVCKIAPANNRQAIQDAIASCPDGQSNAPTVIRFPPKSNYHHDDSIELRHRRNIILDGQGSTFTATNRSAVTNWSQLILFKARNVVVRNFHMVGNFQPDRAVYPRRQIMSHYCEAQAGVAFYGGVNITVEDSTSRFACGDGFGAYTSRAYSDGKGIPNEAMEIPTDLVMQRLATYSTARMCWGATTGTRVTIVDNYCEDAWSGVVDMETDTREESVTDIVIARNRAKAFNIYGVLVPVGGPSGFVRNIKVHDNVFETPPDNACYPSVWIGTAQYSPALRFAEVEVFNNTIHAIGAAVAFFHVDGGSIRSNTVYRLPTTGGGTIVQECGWGEGHFVVDDSTGVTVADNAVLTGGPSGTTTTTAPATSTSTTTTAPPSTPTTSTVPPTTTTTRPPTTTSPSSTTTTTRPL